MICVNTTGQVLHVHNEVPGYRKIIREGPNAPCKCTQDKVDFDAKFYMGLHNQFQNKEQVDAFVATNFANHMVVGLHVHAGNGEKGNFVDKNRMIHNPSEWVSHITENVCNMTHLWEKPLLLYIATDTPSMVDNFCTALAGIMNVTYFPQKHADKGGSVFFGERGVIHTVIREKNQCLDGWDSMIKDLLILSHADVVIAAQPSSFTQMLPMSLVLNHPKDSQTVMFQFCETNPKGTAMYCFENYMDWCCNGIGSFIFAGINQWYDYTKVPYELEKQIFASKRRPPTCNLSAADALAQRECIPFSWLPT